MTKKIPLHQWTHDGEEVLIIKCVGKNGETYNGFKWPLEVGAKVDSPNWQPIATCESGGLFGWPWGLNIGDGKDPDWQAIWLCFGAKQEDVIDLGGKVKAKQGTVRAVGSWHEITGFVLKGQIAYVFQNSRGSASNSGYRGSASSTATATAAICTGADGRAKAGTYSIIALAWWNKKKQRYEMKCAQVGKGDGKDKKLKANRWYRLNKQGKFVEDKNGN